MEGTLAELRSIAGMPFMQHALLAGLLASVACGVIGTLIAANRMLFLAGGVAHAAYGGVGLALFLSLPVLPVTLVFSITAALLMSSLAMKSKMGSETFIGALWAVGMAVGIILIDLTPGYRADLSTYLFGNILAVSYAVKGRIVIALMTINPDGSLSGNWLRRTDRGSKGTETWKKKS